MANNFTSNTTKQIAEIISEQYESTVVLAKSVDNQVLTPLLTPKSGGEISVRRPTDYVEISTPDGDLTSETESDIIVGSSNATVQNYITTWTTWKNVEQALDMDKMDELLQPMTTRIVTSLEKRLGSFMINNAGLHYGTPGTAVSAWSDVAGAGALMDTLGVPNDGRWNYCMNPFATTALADAQGGLASGSNNLVDTAWQRAQITDRFGGLSAMTSNALSSYTAGDLTDRAGIVSAPPTPTYEAHKDTMIQSIAVSGFGAGTDTILAGEIVQITGRNHINLSTKGNVTGADGNQILWSGVVTADVTLAGGAGTLLVAGPAIFEAGGAYNTVDSAVTTSDVITVLGAAGAVNQPNMFYHEQAFGVGFVELDKLYATDTVVSVENGFSLRVTRYSDGTANQQRMRVDMLPAFICFNPFFAGQGFGVA